VQKQGQQRIYSLDPQGLAELRAYIDSFWDRVLEAFQSAAENSADIKPAKEDLRNE
jgi:hypothetical protein